MEPSLKDGSFLIASRIPFMFAKPKPGGIILFDSEGKSILKKIVGIEDEKYSVLGENKLDDKKFSPVPRNKILGKVIIKI